MTKCKECNSNRPFHVKNVYQNFMYILFIIKCPDCPSFTSFGPKLSVGLSEKKTTEEASKEWEKFNTVASDGDEAEEHF